MHGVLSPWILESDQAQNQNQQSEGGWNQKGGPELLTFDNHKGKNAFVLFNDGWIKLINSEEAAQLKWKPDED